MSVLLRIVRPLPTDYAAICYHDRGHTSKVFLYVVLCQHFIPVKLHYCPHFFSRDVQILNSATVIVHFLRKPIKPNVKTSLRTSFIQIFYIATHVKFMCAGRNTVWTTSDLVWTFVRSADSFCPWLLIELPSWGKVTMSRMCLFLTFLLSIIVLHTLIEQKLYGELRRGHITSNLQRALGLKIGRDGESYILESYITEASPSYFHCLFFYSCTRALQ